MANFATAFAKVLIGAGFVHRDRTAAYEYPQIGPGNLSQVMGEFWQVAQTPPAGARLDHVWWTYADNPPRR